jgi:hypothetical protein
MAEFQLTLTEEEKRLLVNLLKYSLGETRTEVHHTHFSPDYRAQVVHEEEILRQLLEKLGAKP